MSTQIAAQPIRLKPLTTMNRIHPISRTQRSAFSTAIRPWDSRPSRQHARPSITSRIPPTHLYKASTLSIRHASSAPTSTSPQTPQSAPEDVLTWNRFFDLRRKRRYLNLGSSVITASTSIALFGPVIASQDIDGWAANVMGLDPILVLGATTFAVATMGWLCGPSFGTAVFKIWAGRRGWNGPIGEVSFPSIVRRSGCGCVC